MAKSKIPSIITEIQKFQPQKIDYSYQKGISFSQLSMYFQCKKHWYLQYVEKHKVFTGSISTVFGTALHNTIQNYLTVLYTKTGTEADKIDLKQYFETQFKETYNKNYKQNQNTHLSTPEEMGEFYDDAVAILDFIKKKRNEYFSKKGWYLVGVEIPVIIAPNKTHKNVLFNGFLDLVLYNETDDQFVIFDIKSSRQSWSDKQKKDPIKQSQILLYKHFFSEQFGINIEKIDVKFFILKRKLWENSDFPQKRIQEFTPANGKTKVGKAKELLDTFIDEVFELDGSYKKKEYEAAPSKTNCRFCPFVNNKTLCSVGIS